MERNQHKLIELYRKLGQNINPPYAVINLNVSVTSNVEKVQ